jgi:hypothetical protein
MHGLPFLLVFGVNYFYKKFLCLCYKYFHKKVLFFCVNYFYKKVLFLVIISFTKTPFLTYRTILIMLNTNIYYYVVCQQKE